MKTSIFWLLLILLFIGGCRAEEGIDFDTVTDMGKTLIGEDPYPDKVHQSVPVCVNIDREDEQGTEDNGCDS